MSYVVAQRVRDFLSAKGLQVSGDLVEAVSAKTESLLEEAAKRAEANGRKTVRPQDL